MATIPPPLPPPPPIPVVTNATDCPTVFADGLWFAANLGDCIRLTFMENMLEPQNSPSPGMKARHVGTLAMPREGFNAMVNYLNDMKAYFDQVDAGNGAA